MKKNILIAIVILVLLVGVFAVYRIPYKVLDISPSEVSKIRVLGDGESEFTDAATITNILNSFDNIKFQRDIPSGMGGRMQVQLLIYDNGGKEVSRITVCTDNTIDDGQFFSHAVDDGKIAVEYLQSLLIG